VISDACLGFEILATANHAIPFRQILQGGQTDGCFAGRSRLR
jgi:hypothetical protein